MKKIPLFLISFLILFMSEARAYDLHDLLMSANVGPPSCSVINYNSPDNIHKMVVDALNRGEFPSAVLEEYVKYFQNGEYRYSSGVFVSEDGCAVTNSHCVADYDYNNSRIIILWSGIYKAPKCVIKAELIARDNALDLALIKVRSENVVAAKFPAVVFSRNGLRLLDRGISITNPLGLSFSPATFEVNGVRTGKEVNAALGKRQFPDNMEILQISGRIINPGSSGGPLFDESGKFCGIFSQLRTLSDKFNYINTGISFAISAKDIKEWLKIVAPTLSIREE
jgi:S1-C subfamily serine protease